MGNSASESNIDEDYEIKQLRDDGSALLRHKKTKQQYQLRSHGSNIEDEMIGFKELLEKRKEVKSAHLLELIQVNCKMEKQVCSILHKLYLLI